MVHLAGMHLHCEELRGNRGLLGCAAFAHPRRSCASEEALDSVETAVTSRGALNPTTPAWLLSPC